MKHYLLFYFRTQNTPRTLANADLCDYIRKFCKTKFGAYPWYQDTLDGCISKYWNQKVHDAKKPSKVEKKKNKKPAQKKDD